MKNHNIKEETKKAWQDNWKDHSVEEALSIFGYTRVQRLLGTFLEHLPKGGKVLEGGCGLGPWVIKLRGLGYDVTGVDYDGVSVSKIKQYDASVPVYVSDIEKMPFEPDFFDAYLSLGVLEHFLEGPQNAIKEANRVLKPGGRFLVMVPYMNMLLRLKYPFLAFRKNAFLRKIFRKENKAFYYEKYFGVNEIKKLIEEGGFRIESVFPADHIFSFVTFSSIFRNRGTYDGENGLAVKLSDFLKGILPWQTAASTFIVAKKI